MFSELPLPGAFRIIQQQFTDERGFFARTYCAVEYANHSLTTQWVQINNSCSIRAGTLRGLHFQRPPMSECKLIRCTSGEVWDVMVDLRKGSATFGRWHGEILSARNRAMIYVPEGFAHGYMALTNDSEVIYAVSQPYSPQHEGCVHWADPTIGICWPFQPSLVSAKDASAPRLDEIQPLEIGS
jgi:dTDP-4-dehydrorhamnose 3,5-epimerase